VTSTLRADGQESNIVSRDTKSRPSDGRSGLSSPRGATTVRRGKTAYKSGTWIDEQHRRYKLTPVRERWERRASELNAALADVVPDGTELQAVEVARMKRCRAYAVARVQRLGADIVPRLVDCGEESLPIACGCGFVGAVKTCRQWWLCGACRARRSPALGAEIRRGIDAALVEAITEWGANGGRGMRPQIVLLTLTQKHTGDLSADQAALAAGWRGLYKRMHEDYGAFPYCGVWEVTRGRDGLGHVHMHLAVVWTYRDWGRVREQWQAACPTSQYLDIKRKRKDGKPSSAASVANYLGKYLSKGADVGGFDGRMRAEVSAAFYNQRSVITSRYFWRKTPKCCRKCMQRYRLVEVEPRHILDCVPAGSFVLHVYGPGCDPPEASAVRPP
jgi:hypothetical protein